MYILGMSMSASVLALFIIILRKFCFNKISKNVIAFLWLFPAVRFLSPFGSMCHVMISHDTPVMDGIYMRTIETYAVPRNPLSIMLTLKLPHIFYFMWLFGAVYVGALYILRHVKSRKLFACSIPSEYDISHLKKVFGIRRNVSLRICDVTDAPLTYGVVKPVVILPKIMDLSDKTTVDNVLYHEFSHIKRFDAAFKAILVLCTVIHWFNPIVWVMFILANKDIEPACDEAAVLKGNLSAKSYAMTLLEIAGYRVCPQTAGFGSGSIEERIIAIMQPKGRRGHIFASALMVTSLIISSLAINIVVAEPRIQVSELYEAESSAAEVYEVIPETTMVIDSVRISEKNSEVTSNYTWTTLTDEYIDLLEAGYEEVVFTWDTGEYTASCIICKAGDI